MGERLVEVILWMLIGSSIGKVIAMWVYRKRRHHADRREVRRLEESRRKRGG
jgi:hypothetical protein